jgi:hypothetical protein
MSLVIEFKPPPEGGTGHWEQVDPRTLKWVTDNPVPLHVVSWTLEVFGDKAVALKGGR